VVNYQRVRRRQLLLEAEGYLELAAGLDDQWPLPAALRERLAQRALDVLVPLSNSSAQRTEILYLTGLAYRTMRRYGEAVPPLEAAADLSPSNISIWLALGWCYKRLGGLPKAIYALEQALLADQQEAIVHYNLACYWSLAGDGERALRFLAQSFDIDPRYRDLVADESDFDPIRDLPDFQSLMGAPV
jgi:tetratricopeptide (TPR) repeat protein